MATKANVVLQAPAARRGTPDAQALLALSPTAGTAQMA